MATLLTNLPIKNGMPSFNFCPKCGEAGEDRNICILCKEIPLRATILYYGSEEEKAEQRKKDKELLQEEQDHLWSKV